MGMDRSSRVVELWNGFAEVNIIGCSTGGTDFCSHTNDRVLCKLGVWAGGWQLRGIRVWLSSSCYPKTFGVPQGSYQEFSFGDGERITCLSLWTNTAGNRVGGLRFLTTKGKEFRHQMTAKTLQPQNEHLIDVASGICVGIEGHHGDDIHALGFSFLRRVAEARLVRVRYPELERYGPRGIEHVTICDFREGNQSYDNSKTWFISGTYTSETSSSWSLHNNGGLVHYLDKVSVTAHIPFLNEAFGKEGWDIGAHKTTFNSIACNEESSNSIAWHKSGVLPPRQWLFCQLATKRGRISTRFRGELEITSRCGVTCSLRVDGVYTGVCYRKWVSTMIYTGSLDDSVAHHQRISATGQNTNADDGEMKVDFYTDYKFITDEIAGNLHFSKPRVQNDQHNEQAANGATDLEDLNQFSPLPTACTNINERLLQSSVMVDATVPAEYPLPGV